MAGVKKWANRASDDRSRPLQIMMSLGAGALYAIIGLIHYYLEIDSTIAKNGLPYFLVLTAIITIGTFFIIPLSRIAESYLFPTLVPEGHVALTKFRGHYTGEFAEPGLLTLPIGYEIEIVDCRQFSLESETLEVRSQDGFIVKANLTAWLKVSDPLRYTVEGFEREELKKLLRSALFSAASRKNALDIVGDRDRICQEALKEVAELASHYGLNVTKVAVDVQSIPEELTSFVQMLTILEKKHPQASPPELIEIIMLNSGKITKTRNESTNINRLEMPGLDLVMAAAAKRFG